MSLPEQVLIGDRFYLRPLMAGYRLNQDFWALALDKNGLGSSRATDPASRRSD